MEESNLGWFHIDNVWDLYIDGELQKVHVDFICVDESADESDEYVVDHYSRDGSLIDSLKLSEADVEAVVGEKQPVERPWHI